MMESISWLLSLLFTLIPSLARTYPPPSSFFSIIVLLIPLCSTSSVPMRAFVDTSETDNSTSGDVIRMLRLAAIISGRDREIVHLLQGIKLLPPIEETTLQWNLHQIVCDDLKTGFVAMLAGTSGHSFPVFDAIASVMQVSSVRLSDRPSPMLFSVHPSPAEILVDYLEYKGWRSVVHIHDGQQNILESFFSVAARKGRDLSVHSIRAPVQEDQFREFLNELHRTMSNSSRSVNVLVDLSSGARVSSCLRSLRDAVFVSNQFNYVFASFHIKESDLHEIKSHALINVTIFEMFNETGTEFTKQKKLYADDMYNEKSASGFDRVPAVAAFAHDAYLVLAYAIKRVVEEQGDIFRNTFFNNTVHNRGYAGLYCNVHEDPHHHQRINQSFEFGQLIAKAIKKTEIGQGHGTLTGYIKFDDQGKRVNYSAIVREVRPGERGGTVQTFSWEHNEGFLLGKGRLFFEPTPTPLDIRKGILIDQPEKIVFTVVSVLVKPFMMLKKASKGQVLEGNDRFEGYCVDLLDKLAEKIQGFQYEIFISEGNKYGARQADGSWDGMIGYLLNGTADLAVAPLTISQERERAVDFSKPFMTTGISIMIQKPEKQEFSIFSFMQPLGMKVWMLTLCSYVGVSLTIFIVSTFSPYEQRVEMRHTEDVTVSTDFSLYNSLWFTLAAFMQQGTDILPRAPSGRIASSVWWFFTLIIVSSYTANLAAFLTLEKMTPPIESVDDLAGQSYILYGLVKGGSTAAFFEDSTVPLYRGMWNFMMKTHARQLMENPAASTIFVDSYADGIEKVRKSKGRYAFLLEETTNNYESTRKPCNTMKVGQNLNTLGYGIATKIGNTLRGPINLAVLYLHEKGELKGLEDKWWYDRGQCDGGGLTESVDSSSLNLSKVAGIFYILSGGMALSLITAAIEFTFRKNIERKKKADKHKIQRSNGNRY